MSDCPDELSQIYADVTQVFAAGLAPCQSWRAEHW